MPRFTVSACLVTLLPSISWDVNLTTLIGLGAGAIAFYLVVMRQRDQLRDMKKAMDSTASNSTVAEVQKAIEHWKLEFLAVKADHNVFKDLVLKEYVRTQDLDPKLDRLFDRIDETNREQLARIDVARREQTEALNRINDHLIAAAKVTGQPRR